MGAMRERRETGCGTRLLRLLVIALVIAVVLWVAGLALGVWSVERSPQVTAVLYVGKVGGSSSGAGSDGVVGSPTISSAFIERVLSAYGSPASGTGAALYSLGVKYDIDPVYALAFFLHEDSFGKTGWGALNHSLGNSRCGGWSSCQGGYRFYPTWQAGYEDWYRLIRYGYVEGQVTIPLVGYACRTVEQIIPVYAPSSDGNDVAGYIAAVMQAVRAWRQGQVWV
jgi:hypothetical protein